MASAGITKDGLCKCEVYPFEICDMRIKGNTSSMCKMWYVGQQ